VTIVLLLAVNAAVWGYALWAASGTTAVETRLARYAGRPGVLQELAWMGRSPVVRLAASFARRRSGRTARRAGRYSEAEMRAAGITRERLEAMRYAFALAAGTGTAAVGFALGGSAAVLPAASLGAAAGYVLPGVMAAQALEARRRQILRALPDTLDLLSVAMNAGLSFDHAVGSVASSRSDHLARLLRTYLDEVGLGRPPAEALLALADRSGTSEVRQVVAHVLQSRRYGAALVDVLRAQADYMRRILRARQRERAGRASVQIVFPLALFIFPATFLLVVAPLVMRLFATGLLSGGGR